MHPVITDLFKLVLPVKAAGLYFLSLCCGSKASIGLEGGAAAGFAAMFGSNWEVLSMQYASTL